MPEHLADVVVVGAGGAGLPAAISARDAGASVIAIDANDDVGGHAILSSGNVGLGGGTSLQCKYGVDDPPDTVYRDLTDGRNPQFRRVDRELVRAFADESAATFEFLLANGVTFEDRAPTVQVFGRGTVPRVAWATGIPEDWRASVNGTRGAAVVRPLEASARRKGVRFLLGHRLTRLVRESDGRISTAVARVDDAEVRIRARRGLILATGGHSSSVAFRRMFDPRLTEEYQTAGEPWTRQDADGEIAAMDVGAALWGVGAQTMEREGDSVPSLIWKTQHIGCRWGYHGLKWDPRSPVFPRARASGLTVSDWQDVILVDRTGRRFCDETADDAAFLHACLGPKGDLGRAGDANGGGPVWAIFDTRAARREHWTCEPPHVDPDGWFFSAPTIAELAARIVNPFQRRAIDPATLVATVERWNLLVETGADLDFGRPTPRERARAIARRILEPPFHAAWATPILHDCLTGVRIDARARVIDWSGTAIPGLYCAGESAGGFGLHGLPRAMVFGRIAGREAARA